MSLAYETQASQSLAGRPKKVEVPERTLEPHPTKDAEVEIVEPDIDEMDWNTDAGIELTWKLITAIEEGTEIRASLFPSIGANKISGGKKKSECQYELAMTLFSEHPDFMDGFAKAKTAKERSHGI
ncbi:hypothetical protein B0H13DRAFT_1861616 [Mycena leptocephala]|nr:hypothetical protein B0H13DRAFT_1861616 [Mycena leptocephala]